ncbi:hypothetical protein JCM5350_006916 [Sporobolomyces pararoseus]
MSIDFSSDEDNDETLSQVPKDSPSSPPLFSLPPEILYDVFDALPPHPSPERTSTLLSLSRVCRKLVDVARKLLYRSIQIDLSIDYEDTDDQNTQPIDTLIEVEECAVAVRNLRITFGDEPGRTDFLHFSYVLSHLTRLRRIYTRWELNIGPGPAVESFCRAIARNCQQLEILELPNVALNQEPVRLIFESLRNLESFTHKITILWARPTPKFKLRKLITRSHASQAAFDLLTVSSLESFINLSLSMHQGKSVRNLSRLINLSTLHLSLKDRAGDDDKFDTRTPGGHKEWIEAVAYRLRTLLVSTHCLEVRTLTISLANLETCLDLSTLPLLDYLPPSLTHLSISSSLLARSNRCLLFPSKPAPSPCPLLQQITILPPCHTGQLDRVTHELMNLVAEALVDECFERRIEVVLAIGRGGSFVERDALDPGRRKGW